MPQLKKQMISLQRRQQLLYIGMFSLVTVMVWLGVSLLLSQRSTQIPAELKKKAQPLTPSINQQVIQQIESKRSFTQEDLADFPIYKLILTREGGEQLVTIDTPELNERLSQRQPTPEPEEDASEEASQEESTDQSPEASSSSETSPSSQSGNATPSGTTI